MLTILISGLVGLLLGAGITAVIMTRLDPADEQLNCSLTTERKVADCRDSEGKRARFEPDITIR